jgi:hypothetical protein
VLLLIVVAVGSYYAARFLLEGWPHRRQHPQAYTRPACPDDDDEFLAQLSRRPEKPDDPS